MVERKGPELSDLTGKFFPDKRRLFERAKYLLVNQRVEKAFWTPRRQELARRICRAVSEELEPFGVPKIEFLPDQVKLRKIKFKPQAGDGPSVPTYEPLTGYIDLYPQLLRSDERNERFAGSYTHEILHHRSLRLRHKRGTFDSWRRVGLNMMVKRGQENEVLFEELDEGVVMTTTRLILKKHFDLDYPTTGPGWFVWEICKTISAVNNSAYSLPEDVFRVFQKATFGRGRALELGKLIEKTYRKGGFRRLGDLLIQARQKIEVKDGMYTVTFTRESLLDFIRGPRRPLDS